MDYVLDREVLPVGETVYDGCQEQPVDLDITLPDYCTDIQRILKCQIYPRITSRSVSGDRLLLEGSFTVKVFYLDAAGTSVRCYDTTDSFSTEIPLKQQADNAQVHAFPRVEYINCRATSPRRLDVHGAFSVCAKVVCMGENEVVGNIEGDDVEQQKSTVTVNRLAGFSQQQFGIDEILELGSGKPPADSIMRSDAFATLQDFKVTAGKLMIRGEVSIKLLYSSSGENQNAENQSAETMEYTVPFSQMLDCNGVTEDSVCDVRLNVAGLDVQIKNDYSGDKTFFDVQVRLFAGASAYQKCSVTMVNDAYSRKYDLNINSRQKTMENLAELVGDTYVSQNSLTVEGEKISKVVDIWNEMGSVSASVENDRMMFRGKFSLCVLAMNEENKPFYFERLLDFEYGRAYSGGAGNTKSTADVSVAGISYRITGTGIDVKTELRLSASVYSQIGYKVITEVTADDTRPLERDTTAALCIYYADAGENLWDIARAYRTSEDAIRQENGISGESVENRGMLLVPMM
jgi:hypothetical protein